MKDLCPTDGRVRILFLAHVSCRCSLVDRRGAPFLPGSRWHIGLSTPILQNTRSAIEFTAEPARSATGA